MRSEYNQWLTYYYQNGLDEAYSELRTHAEDKHMKEYEETTKRTMQEADRLRDSGKLPSPGERSGKE